MASMEQEVQVTKILPGGYPQAESEGYLDYEDFLDEEKSWKAVVDYCVETRVKVPGMSYQHTYMPILNEKYYFLVSIRVWSLLMAEVWSKLDGKEYGYLDFYWN
jgi:hypothetical protein